MPAEMEGDKVLAPRDTYVADLDGWQCRVFGYSCCTWSIVQMIVLDLLADQASIFIEVSLVTLVLVQKVLVFQ